MEKKNELQTTQRRISTQMRAVLTILSADPYVMEVVKHYINLDTETIQWDPIFKFGWSSGHRACVLWAYSLWTDEIRTRSNPFDAALSLNPKLQTAVLTALSIRWGLGCELRIVS
ncbi:MAG: hypothetical protein JNL11_17045 [Bdellovibrionaceae bacterium]|nr:hypothetical protein [Pseudobdellovibrionaceae bacterium]